MNILYLIPGPMDQEEMDRREMICNEMTSSRATVDVDDTEGPTSIESSTEEELAAGPMISALWKNRDRYDAVVLGCFGDPILRAAREICRIPVIGPGEATVHFASLLCDDFSIITVLDRTVPVTEEQMRALGVDHRISSIRPVNLPVLDLEGGLGGHLQDFQGVADSIVEEDGAEGIVLGCMSQGFDRLDEELDCEVPVLNPVKVGLGVAELQVSLGLSHSRTSYPPVDEEKIGEVLR